MGPCVKAVLERPGFYPAGGGKCRITITPAAALQPLELRTRGALRARRACAIIANLPPHIARRELAVIGKALAWPDACLHLETVQDSPGPGNLVTIDIESEHVTEVFTGFGQRGVPAEKVAAQAVNAAQRYLACDVAAGVYLADQLLLPLALAGSGVLTTLPLSQHTRTNIHIIEQFLAVTFSTVQLDPQIWQISVQR